MVSVSSFSGCVSSSCFLAGARNFLSYSLNALAQERGLWDASLRGENTHCLCEGQGLVYVAFLSVTVPELGCDCSFVKSPLTGLPTPIPTLLPESKQLLLMHHVSWDFSIYKANGTLSPAEST